MQELLVQLSKVIICPTNLHAKAVMDGLKGSGIETGIQNISKTDAGAFTGEVLYKSPPYYNIAPP